MEITPKSKVLEVLKEHPALEELLLSLAPPFKNLRNPVLRRTVAQLATLEAVARIGRLEVATLVNTLRRAAGQPELVRAEAPAAISPVPAAPGDPPWITAKPDVVVDGGELLRHGEVPLQHINHLLGTVQPGGVVLLMTDFEPVPMLEAMQKLKRRTYCKPHPTEQGKYLTYIQ